MSDFFRFTTPNKEFDELSDKIQFASSIQGSVSYIFMSVLAVHRESVVKYTSEHIFPFFFANMVYGMAVLLYNRPAFVSIYKFHRFSFSLLGSLMFNHASMRFFNWTAVMLPENPWTRTFASFVCGRLMLFYFISYLYHVDSTVTIPIFSRLIL